MIQSSARLSQAFFFNCGVPLELFLAIFPLSRAKAFLSSETNCSQNFVSFVSRERQFRLLSFEDHQFGCNFKQKLKRMPFPPLSLHEQRLAPMNAHKGKR
jgi:hypothetical protein